METRPFRKVLLISCPDEILGMNLVTIPNLGLERLAATVKDVAEVQLLDLKLTRKKVRNVVKSVLSKFKPDIVGISCMTFQYPTGLKIANFIKGIDPEIKTVFGGYHPSLCADDVLKEGVIDYVVRGEGEITFAELVEGKKLESIDGLSYKSGGNIVHNKPRKMVEDLNSLPFPYRKVRIFKKGYGGPGGRAETIETSRGCTNACKFCSIKHFYGRSFRTFGIGRVIDEIKAVRSETNPKWIFIIDDNISLDMDRIGELCDAIIQNGLNDIKYIVQASSVGIGSRRDVVEKMADAGFKIVFLGIENTDKNRLMQLGKGDIVDYSKMAIKNLHDFDILIVGGFIVGMPDDDRENILGNANFALENKVNVPIFFISTPYPKTEWAEELDKMGLITNKTDFSKYTASFANVRTKHLDSDELLSAAFGTYKKFYTDSILFQLRHNRFFRDPIYWTYAARLAFLFLKLKLMAKILGAERTISYIARNNVNF